MRDTAKDRLYRRIRAHKRGWAFSASDFSTEFSRGELDVALSDLASCGDIRRVARGIYDYPAYSTLLDKRVACDIHQVAQAIGRKFNWTIFPNGNTALNCLGLSNQVAANNVYLSNGPSRKYTIDAHTIEFRHASLRDLAISKSANLVTQALRAVSESQLSPEFIKSLALKFSPDEWEKILAEVSRSANWIVEAVKTAAKISSENCHGQNR